MYKLFLYLLLCTVIGLFTACITPLICSTADRMECFITGFVVILVMFAPRKLISQRCTQILNFIRVNRSNLTHALLPALGMAALCGIVLPVVASTAWVVVWAVLAFGGVIALFLYLQGSFSS